MVAIKIAAFGGKFLAEFGQAECRQKIFFARIMGGFWEEESFLFQDPAG